MIGPNDRLEQIAAQIIDRYPWVSEGDAKRIAELAAIRAQQTVDDYANGLHPEKRLSE